MSIRAPKRRSNSLTMLNPRPLSAACLGVCDAEELLSDAGRVLFAAG
jgi:hypothetical protein